MTTPNLGLTIPVGGTTAGALNNSTVGTYPYIEAANLNLIDSLCYSANTLVPVAGLNINANLNMGAFNITNVGTLSGTAVVVTNGIFTNVEGNGANALNITTALVAASASADVVINNTVTRTAGLLLDVRNNGSSQVDIDYNGNLALNVGILEFTNNNGTILSSNSPLFLSPSSATVGVVINSQVTQSSGRNTEFKNNGTEILNIGWNGDINLVGGGKLLQTKATTSLTIKGNAAASSATGVIIDNATIQTSGTATSFCSGGAELTNFDYLGNLNLTAGGGVVQTKSTTSLTLKGNAAATGAVGTILDNATTQTTGTATSFRSGGAELTNFDYLGNLNLTAGGGVIQTKSTTALTLTGNLAATGANAVILTNATQQNAGLAIVAVENNATVIATVLVGHASNIGAMGVHHYAGRGSVPALSALAAGWGTTTSSSVTGTDFAHIIAFTTGTGGSISAGTVLFTVTLNNVYSSSSFVPIIQYAATTGGVTAAFQNTFFAVPTAAGTYNVFSSATFTPATGTALAFQIITVAAAATY